MSVYRIFACESLQCFQLTELFATTATDSELYWCWFERLAKPNNEPTKQSTTINHSQAMQNFKETNTNRFQAFNKKKKQNTNNNNNKPV